MRRCFICLGLMLFLFVSGCVHVQYNPTTKDFTYLRIGEQKIGSLEIETPEGVEVTLEDQKASADELVKAIAKLDPIMIEILLVLLGL